MKIEITKRIEQIETIEVDLPYYYIYDLMSDYGESIIYGKIEERCHTSIKEETYKDQEKYEIEKEEHYSIKNSGLANYFDKKHHSTQEEYETVKQRCMIFLNSF